MFALCRGDRAVGVAGPPMVHRRDAEETARERNRALAGEFMRPLNGLGLALHSAPQLRLDH